MISPHLVAGLAEAVFLNDLSAGGLVAGGLVAGGLVAGGLVAGGLEVGLAAASLVTLDLVPGLPAFDLEARRFTQADPPTH